MSVRITTTASSSSRRRNRRRYSSRSSSKFDPSRACARAQAAASFDILVDDVMSEGGRDRHRDRGSGDHGKASVR